MLKARNQDAGHGMYSLSEASKWSVLATCEGDQYVEKVPTLRPVPREAWPLDGA